MQYRPGNKREKQRYKSLKVLCGSGDDVGPEMLGKLQEEDPALENVRKLIADGVRSDESRYMIRKGSIYRYFSSPKVDNGKLFMQIFVPEKLRDIVMRSAHDSVISTTHKVLSEFYCPGVLPDVFPEAVALPSIEAKRVAEALFHMFCRLWVPSEILTDMGSQFTSEVMKEVSRLLSVKQLTTTPYHPMYNGLIEMFNGTMKQIL